MHSVRCLNRPLRGSTVLALQHPRCASTSTLRRWRVIEPRCASGSTPRLRTVHRTCCSAAANSTDSSSSSSSSSKDNSSSSDNIDINLQQDDQRTPGAVEPIRSSSTSSNNSQAGSSPAAGADTLTNAELTPISSSTTPGDTTAPDTTTTPASTTTNTTDASSTTTNTIDASSSTTTSDAAVSESPDAAAVDDAAVVQRAQQDLQESWQHLKATARSLFLGTPPTNQPTTTTTTSSTDAATGAQAAAPPSTPAPADGSALPTSLPDALGRLLSGQFLVDYKRLEQQWKAANTAAGADGAASEAAARQGGAAVSSFVPASQQVIDVEVIPAPPPTTTSTSSSAAAAVAAGGFGGGGAPADPWGPSAATTTNNTPTVAAEPAADAAGSDPSSSMSAVLDTDAETTAAAAVDPRLRQVLLPCTSLLVMAQWGVWVLQWVAVLPAVVAAIQLGDLGRVLWSMLLTYPGISPIVDALVADAGQLLAGHWGGLLSSSLLHSGLLSVALCAAGIEDTGEDLEPAMGPYQLLLLYLLSGTGAVFWHWLLGGQSLVMSGVGAVMGLYGARLMLAIKMGPGSMPTGSDRGVLILLLGLALGAWQPAVGMGSVLGGFVTGAAVVFLVPYLAAAIAWLLYIPFAAGLFALRLAGALAGLAVSAVLLLVVSTAQVVVELVRTIRGL